MEGRYKGRRVGGGGGVDKGIGKVKGRERGNLSILRITQNY